MRSLSPVFIATLVLVGIARPADAHWSYVEVEGAPRVATNESWLFLADNTGDGSRLYRIDADDPTGPRTEIFSVEGSYTGLTVIAPTMGEPGRVYVMVRDLTNPSTHRSLDAGDTWDTIYDLECGEHVELFGFSVTPTDPPRLLAIGTRRPVRSLDDGVTWSSLSPPPYGACEACYCGPLPRDPVQAASDPDVLWIPMGQASMDINLLRSTDGGDTWDNIDYDFHRDFDVAVDPLDASRVYKWGSVKVQRSEDGGDTFVDIFDPSYCDHVHGATDRVDFDTFVTHFCRTLWSGVHLTRDAGETWEEVSLQGHSPDARAILQVVDLVERGRLYAGETGKLWIWQAPSVAVPTDVGPGTVALDVRPGRRAGVVRLELRGHEGEVTRVAAYDVAGRRLDLVTVAGDRDPASVTLEVGPGASVVYIRASTASGREVTTRAIVGR